MSIEIRSFNQILGDMIRKIISETPLNDLNAGSVLLSLLEACASNDFENNTAILNVLELLNIDAVKNNDLDSRAGDYGLSRNAAIKASGQVSILNTNIVKRSTGLYVIKPAPIQGQTTIYVNNTTGWAPTGALFIGRDTESFEGPINYTAITQFPTYSAITLASALQKDHLISDTVIDSQGQPDRVIAAGTVVKIPANNQNPEINYTTLRDAVIPSGEDRVDGVDVIAVLPGSQGNAMINTITQFNTLPFSGAAVTNTSAFSNGRDVETDTELRNRIKSYSITLARGTAPAILSAVIGVSDPDESKQVASAVLTEPVKVGDPSIMYIDDGSGFEPSQAGQSVDLMLPFASGTEEFLQLANYPVPRPQVVNVVEGPFTLTDGMYLRVVVDGNEETVFFQTSDFLNIAAATVAEVIVAINTRSTLFKVRFTDNSQHMLMYPVASDAEIIQVSPLRSSDNPLFYVNTILKFPTNEFSYISLYQNSTRLKEKPKNASLETSPFASWNVTVASNIIIAVDNTPAQDRPFAITDFPGASSFAALSLDDWVTAFNQKFAGLTATATPSQTMKITSNKVGTESAINVTGGSLLNKWFPNLPLTSVGQTAQFELNRQTGNLRILSDILPGDAISAGVEDAKGFSISSETTSGTYNVSNDGFGRPAEMVVVVDSTYCDQRAVPLLIGSTITISDEGSSVMRILSSAPDTFTGLLPGDFIYMVSRTSGWLSAGNTGLYKIIRKGPHLTANVDTYVEVLNDSIVAPETVSVADSQDIKAFTTDVYPQIWRGSYVTNPPAEPLSGIVTSLNRDLAGVKASVFKSKAIKLTSATETNGSIAIPVSIGLASVLFAETTSAQLGNPSHIAHRISDKSLLAFFRRTVPTATNVFLGRHTYVDVKGPLLSNGTRDVPPFSATYSDQVEVGSTIANQLSYDDILSLTHGNNKDQFRSIKAIITGDTIGTQQGVARTEFDHIAGDQFEIMRPLQFSTDDSMVVVMDGQPTTKTVDIKLSRIGLINSGSGGGTFIPTTTEFSANDYDNEPGIDFSNVTVWGTTVNNTDFSDYAVWMRSRNWYSTDGVAGIAGKMIVRAVQYGPNGDKLRFAIIHPQTPNQSPTTTFINTPSYSTISYVFGSGAARPIALTAGDTMAVDGPYPDDSTNFPAGASSTGEYYDYTFSAGNFAPVVVGDVISIATISGISSGNRGQFRVANVSGNTVRVFNPNGSTTLAPVAESTPITVTGETLGSQTAYNVTTVADVAGSLHQTYFIIYDTAGSVAVWFDVGNVNPVPPAHGAARAIRVATIIANDSANTVASKIQTYLNNDPAFTASVGGNTVTITNKQEGITGASSAGTSGFVTADIFGTNPVTLAGKYFIIYDDNGSVAVWFDPGSEGNPEPFHGAQRSIKVDGYAPGSNANTVASAVVAAVNPDTKFNASALGAVVTVVNSFFGNVPDATPGNSSFTIGVITPGSLGSAELITNAGGINLFPLTGTDVTTITATINDSDVLVAAAVGNPALLIEKATVEEDYAYSGNSSALGYGHNPTDPALRSFIGLYDGVNWVKTFQNANPNFTMKTAFILNNVAPSVYQMDTTPNPNTADLGEFFKLIPTTVKNFHHHLTQKALSQLPIVSDIDISNNRRNVQIKSKQLGSNGVVEIIGGQANKAKAYILSESEVANDSSGNYLQVSVPAFPDTFNSGDVIKIENDAGVKRFSRLISSDTIDVTNPSAGIIEYNYNPKSINVNSGTLITITDVSGTYGRPAGYVWRWTHNGGGPSLAQVRTGDLLAFTGTPSGWDQGNKARIGGDGRVSGLTIVAVNDGANWVDVINPYGRAMSSTAISTGSLQIFPTPINKWNLNHAARAKVSSMSRVTNVITITTFGAHMLNTGDSIDVIDSDNLIDGIYGPVTVLNASQFTFASVGSNFSEGAVNASILNIGNTQTRYKIEKLGFNSLTRISRVDGQSPRFLDCGVAVDDYFIITGSTFKSNNNGRFRVIAVDNDSVIYLNDTASDEMNTIVPFNNKTLVADWVSNSPIVTGVAGTFKNLNVGDWVKKAEDPETYYRQILSMNAAPASATSITLGGNYGGSTASAAGVFYDQLNNADEGVVLQDIEDLQVLEGDASTVGDSLFVQNIINSNWFSVNNIGTFGVTEVGTNPTTQKPFIRINNSNGVAETNRLMSINPAGFYLIEGLTYKFYSIRQVSHIVLDDLNQDRRSIYITPSNRSYKFSSANTTSVSHMGKLGYNTDVTTGIDGYLYYTGLLRRVQRIVDGYEPDADNFPGRRAVGGAIEILPPLIKRINISINVTTDEGINLGDISNIIKSVIIQYVQGLGVGEDVILSEIIANVMQVKGVAAVTFTNPVPSTERIVIADNEKATIVPENIGIA